MFLGTLVALALVTTPGDVSLAEGAGSGDVRFTQDEFGDPPPPPPAVDDGGKVSDAPPPPELQEPAPPPGGEPKKKKKKKGGEDGDDGEPGFVEKYFPLSLDEDLQPAVDEKLWAFWVVQILPFFLVPQTWLTPILLDGEGGEDWVVDSIIIYVSHLLPHACLYAAPLPCLFVPYVNLVAIPCVLGCYALNGAACLANTFYLMPVAFANRLNDGFTLEDDGGEEKKRKKRQKKDARDKAPKKGALLDDDHGAYAMAY